MRYVELNPVQANMVIAPGESRWSSYRVNALGADDPVVTPHGEYLALSATGEARQLVYRSLFAGEIDEQDCLLIRAATQHGGAGGRQTLCRGHFRPHRPAGASRPAWSAQQEGVAPWFLKQIFNENGGSSDLFFSLIYPWGDFCLSLCRGGVSKERWILGKLYEPPNS